MKKAHLLIDAAFVVHVFAWLLPVEKDGVTLPDGLPGLQAFLFAAGAWHEWRTDPSFFVVLSVMSAATTVLFVLGAGWVVALRSRRLRRVSAWIAACAFAVNAHWVIEFRPVSNLRVGYFLWWASFLLLAVGLSLLSDVTESPRSSVKIEAGR